MRTTTQPLIDEYLRRLEQAARVLPRGQADDLVAEIRGHIDAGLSDDTGEAEVRNLLDALGSPEEIVTAARPDAPPRQQRRLREIAALILLVTGFPLIVGWLIGLALLLSSRLWTAQQKLLGALVFPGGYCLTLVALGVLAARTGGAGDSSQGAAGGVLLFAVLLIAPLAVATYLYRAAGRQAGDAEQLTP